MSLAVADEETNSNTGANQTEEVSQDSSLASSSVAVAASFVEQQNCANVNASDRNQELPQTFPQRLFDILSNDNYSDCIAWLEHGKGFVIRDKRAFAERVLPKYFKKSKFTSFTRKLNRWNFTRVTRGPESGAYYHPLFTKGAPKLLLQMTCINARQTQEIHPMDPVALGVMNQAGNALAQQQYNFGSAMMQQQLAFQQQQQQQQAFLQQLASAQLAAQQSNTSAASITNTVNLENNELGSNVVAARTQPPQEQGLAIQQQQQQLAFNLYQQQQYFTMIMAQQAQQQQLQMHTMGATMAQQQAQQFQQQQQLEQPQQNVQWQPQQFQPPQEQPFLPQQLLQGQENAAVDMALHVVSEQHTSNFAESNDFADSTNNETIKPGDEESIYETAELADYSVDL